MTIGDLFRPEALRNLAEPDLGSVLRLPPWWLPVTSWLLTIAAVATSVVAVRTSMPVYERGVGMLRSGVTNLSQSVSICSLESLNTAGARTTPVDAGSRSATMYVAVLPANLRPKLAPGMRVQLRLSGYPDVVVAARLETLGDRLLTAEDARSVLRSLGAEASGIEGPVVSICGSIETDRFESGGVEYRFQDGMLASARVRVSDERLVDRFFPRVR